MIFLILFTQIVFAGPLSEKLETVRSKRLNIEKALLESEQAKKTTQEQIARLRTLQKLQGQEKQLTQKRLEELKKYLVELSNRKEDVLKRIREERVDLRARFSRLVHPVLYRSGQFIRGDHDEGEAALKRRIYTTLVMSELKELESLNADLQDAEEIQSRIEHEQDQMQSLLQDLNEQENLLQFHQQVRDAMTTEKHEERLQQLDEYRSLRKSEIEIERMIEQFQTRQEHTRSQEKKRTPVLAIHARSLPWPIKGKVVGYYGPQKDHKTGLTIFRKGIDIEPDSENLEAISVFDGIVQFSGEIPGKGKIIIIEHPHDLYTIYGGFKTPLKQRGDAVKLNEKIAAGNQGAFYFEIRSRNLALDPLKWLQ